MIYWYTGQPGHGKTLQAIARALEFKKQGRAVYVCNVRDFDYAKTGMLEMKPEDFRNWMQFLPDGAVCLVDEAYEHGMLPKRPPSQKLPEHVERLATHRHKGLDFIFVCQSPDKQVDIFVHDLIEEHVHVRRRFGTNFQHLRKFDRFERNPEKATPLTIKRTRLPKHVFGLYKSTELDTTERKIPWYFIALAIGLPVALGFTYWTFSGLGERLGGKHATPAPSAIIEQGTDANGASATVADRPRKAMTAEEHLEHYAPRVASQPWSAPAYDGIAVPQQAPRVFCMSSAPSLADDYRPETTSCTCITEQGTRYVIQFSYCIAIARRGQYEPLYDEQAQRLADGQTQINRNLDVIESSKAATSVVPNYVNRPDTVSEIFPRSLGYEPGSSGPSSDR